MTTQASEGKTEQADKCLYISSQVELEEFWVQILPAFVELVEPDSGLLIDLYSGGELLTDTDYESLVTGKDHVPRKHRARKLWCILSTYPLGVFNSKLAPKLCAWYGLITPERFRPLTTPVEDPATGHVKPEEECFRHDVQSRVRLESLADLLCHHGCLHVDVYRKLVTTISRNVDEKWCLLFVALAQSPSELLTNPESPLHTLLNRYHVTCPDNIVDIQSRGFPCECKHSQASPPVIEICTETKVLSWRERALSSIRPFSSDSSVTNVDVSSSSLSSFLRPVSASSGRSDMMATKTESESDSHFDGMFCNGAGFPPSEKLTRKSVSEVNVSSNIHLQYIQLSRAGSDGNLKKGSSSDEECMPFNKSTPKSDKKHVTEKHDVSKVPECADQDQVNVESMSHMEENESDIAFPESCEPLMSSDENYETPKRVNCCIINFTHMLLMAMAISKDADTVLQVDEIETVLDHGPRADDMEKFVSPKNCLDRILVHYKDHTFFEVFCRELRWAKTTAKNISQIFCVCADKYICRKRKFPPFPKQLVKLVLRTILLIFVFTYIYIVFATTGQSDEAHIPFLHTMWRGIGVSIVYALAIVLAILLGLVLPGLCCKMLCAMICTSVWVLWKMSQTKPVVDVESSMHEVEAYQTTSV